MRSATVIGGGAWGTALAIHLAGMGSSVRLWMYEADLVERMLARRDNPVYLPGVRIPDSVAPTSSFSDIPEDTELVVTAVPSHFARGVYRELASHLAPTVPLLLATKGIEEDGLALPTQAAREVLGSDRRCAVLSGPSFAAEVARGVPTAAVVAADDGRLAEWIQNRMSGGNLRLYTNRDPVGVQVAGALKNVIAIAAGIVEGLEMGHNTLAALVTRGLAEISRLGVTLGGSPPTFSGLAGLGDLVVTCTGVLSRNRRVGEALGRGERLQDVVRRRRSVAEGVRTTRSARELARRAGVEMPIVEEMYRILYEDSPPREAVVRLMSRPLTAEDRPGGRRETSHGS